MRGRARGTFSGLKRRSTGFSRAPSDRVTRHGPDSVEAVLTIARLRFRNPLYGLNWSS